MFDKDDPERLAQHSDSVPDGLIDGTQYAQIIENITDALTNLKMNDYVSGITFVMNCVNQCYDADSKGVINPLKAVDTATALAYFVMSLADALDQVDPELLEEYIQHHQDVVVPQINANKTALPFYNSDCDTVKRMFNSIDSEEWYE